MKTLLLALLRALLVVDSVAGWRVARRQRRRYGNRPLVISVDDLLLAQQSDERRQEEERIVEIVRNELRPSPVRKDRRVRSRTRVVRLVSGIDGRYRFAGLFGRRVGA